MSHYAAPAFNAKAFTCPHCVAYAGMDWHPLTAGPNEYPAFRVLCAACSKPTYWRVVTVAQQGKQGTQYDVGAEMMWPQTVTAPPAHPDLYLDLQADFEEARSISKVSPRGAAALLRLVIEKLVKELGAKGDTIDKMIGDLVSKGLPVQVQQALDTVRVIGNNAVHAGKMDQADVGATVDQLFALVNIIVEQQITQPKKIAELFGTLPEGARNGIEKRDTKPS